MPAKQTLRVQWLVIRLGRVQHHLDNTINMAIRRDQSANFQTQPLCDRRSNLILVECLSFDLAAFHDITGQCPEHRLVAKIEAKTLHAPQEFALAVTDRSKL